MADQSAPLRTRIYVDGYNLYYGRLKRTRFKWLDLQSLFQAILPTILLERNGSPARFQSEGLFIKYFTAPILKNFAKADDSVSSQFIYHEALRNHIGDGIQIVEGYYDSNRARAHRFEKGTAARECEKVEIWKLEEKQTDVALAVHMVADTLRNEIDQVVVVTNDTDIVPALQLIRANTTVTIGLVVPARGNERRVNTDLQNLADWTRSHILDEELAAAQLPPMVRSPSSDAICAPLEFVATLPRIPHHARPTSASNRWGRTASADSNVAVTVPGTPRQKGGRLCPGRGLAYHSRPGQGFTRG